MYWSGIYPSIDCKIIIDNNIYFLYICKFVYFKLFVRNIG